MGREGIPAVPPTLIALSFGFDKLNLHYKAIHSVPTIIGCPYNVGITV